MKINTGAFLRVDLTSGVASKNKVPEEITQKFIGGRGYGIHYLFSELEANADPLGPENKLIFVTGPLSGTSAQGVSRWMTCTKSPLTGAFARSVCGADFGAWMRFAGYEFIIIEGTAEKPVYLYLTAEGCEIKDAEELWGTNTSQTQERLKQIHGKNTRIACIGPAGEKLVRYAAVVSDRRTAGRCGTGTVMGSKKLKAIAITAKRDITLSDPDTYRQLANEQIEIIRKSQGFKNHKEWGTTRNQDITNSLGVYPVRNAQLGRLKDCEEISGEKYRKLRTGEFGCYSCIANCGKAHSVNVGEYAGVHSEGPEYESIWAFTGPIENRNIEATIAADQLCDNLGLDTISTGSCIGFAYELFEKGILTLTDTDGLELNYGNHGSMVKLVEKIAFREGFGNVLAEGTKLAAEAIGNGAEDYAMHVKGLELSAFDPRGTKTNGFNFATANIGASHCYGFAAQDIYGLPFPREVNRFGEAENADIVVFNQNGQAWRETGIICTFAAAWEWIPTHFGRLLAAARGLDGFADFGQLQQIGERIYNLEKMFNLREGFNRSHDTLPKRMLSEPLKTLGTPGNGEIIQHLDEFLDNYYNIRGWTSEGVPSHEKLKELNIGYAAL
jgi:aldehyde:ferredoxin oxidoreductase